VLLGRLCVDQAITRKLGNNFIAPARSQRAASRALVPLPDEERLRPSWVEAGTAGKHNSRSVCIIVCPGNQ